MRGRRSRRFEPWAGPRRCCRCGSARPASAPTTTPDTAPPPWGTSLDVVLGGVAALDIATGRVTGLRKPRHRHQEFLLFLKPPARACPERELHLVMDNYATHKSRSPGVAGRESSYHVHFAPTSASWMNLVEVWSE
ncbi:transposase [Rhodococcus jostii]|uniref:transposase n=1 Tax=Rhodococcus jostii TaxID=132919 RepID=UPI0013C2C092